MTDWCRLLKIDRLHPVVMLETDAEDVAGAAMQWREAGLTVRFIRGRKMRTVQAMFDEVAAALQFPQYFGENWPAFDECLCDMDWLSVEVGIVIVVVQPSEVLLDEPDVELAVFLRMLAHAADVYSLPIDSGEWWDRAALPFHVVLQVKELESQAVRARWTVAGAAISNFVR